VSLVTTKQYL